MGGEDMKRDDQQEAAAAATVSSAGKEADCDVGKAAAMPKDRAVGLERALIEKRLALIKAWEENEKIKAHSKASKGLRAIEAGEKTKRAALEAELKQIEEKFEREKAEYVEKMKKRLALLEKEAQEKRAVIEAEREEEFRKVEEAAAKFRATDTVPRKSCTFCGRLPPL